MVERLVASVLNCRLVSQIVVTVNLVETLQLPIDDRVFVIANPQPKGFGANHNAAFKLCQKPYFCVLNPDIELIENPFPVLLTEMEQKGCALGAPMVIAPDGQIEDSVRYFPTLASLIRKLFGDTDGQYTITPGQPSLSPEWVAGMFMLFRSEDYLRLGGFDEGYFLYYEDVDICARLWQSGCRLIVCPQIQVIHDARRASHRSLRHLRWHVASLLRYFAKHAGRLPSVA